MAGHPDLMPVMFKTLHSLLKFCLPQKCQYNKFALHRKRWRLVALFRQRQTQLVHWVSGAGSHLAKVKEYQKCREYPWVVAPASPGSHAGMLRMIDHSPRQFLWVFPNGPLWIKFCFWIWEDSNKCHEKSKVISKVLATQPEQSPAGWHCSSEGQKTFCRLVMNC